jgi:RNA polymerase sigma-70 factor (ECF subfamily)
VTAALYVEDVLLVDRCLTGEPAATRELFRRHRNRVHACLFRVLGGNRDMDDLLQDAFLQVFQSLRGWRAEASLATWIDRVAVRSAYRYLSQRGRRVATDPLDGEGDVALASHGDGPSARRQLAREGMLRLYAVLDELSPSARLAFTLHELDGRPLAETADLVGSSVTATKLRVWRARKRIEAAAAADPVLSEFLEPTGGGGVISIAERGGSAGGGDPDGLAGGAGVLPRGINQEVP